MKTNPVRLLSAFVLLVLLSCSWQPGNCQPASPTLPRQVNQFTLNKDDIVEKAVGSGQWWARQRAKGDEPTN